MAQEFTLKQLELGLPAIPADWVRSEFIACGCDPHLTEESLFLKHMDDFMDSLAAAAAIQHYTEDDCAVATIGPSLPPHGAKPRKGPFRLVEGGAWSAQPHPERAKLLEESRAWRAEAEVEFQAMRQCFTRAANANRPDLVEDGYLHQAKMRSAHTRAAASCFNANNDSRLLTATVQSSERRETKLVVEFNQISLAGLTVDLHGLQVKEALAVVEQLLRQRHISDCRSRSEKIPLVLVTGKGNHSDGGRARILPAVTTYLSCRKASFTVRQGKVTVQ